MNAAEARARIEELQAEALDAQALALSWIKQKIDEAVETDLAYSVEVTEILQLFPRAQLQALKIHLEDVDKFVVTVTGTTNNRTVTISWDTIKE